ncbi:MAG TPA: NrfD/PsrC family molybdoenzyme membrane anchor subunit [Verrucomicrobiae bacterium]|nr:NrfD/PsrC family molybdoenzyme membrane anchor subunit [Verrucomicrobiae bacterium]
MADSSTQLESLAPPAELRRMTAVPTNRSLGWLTDKLTAFNEGKTPLWWWILFLPAAFCAAVVLPAMLTYKISTGVGVWGNNMPVMWGWDIINFVWWVGIAHAGTLISAMLFLTRQHWRTPIGRAAEAMTVFSVAMAGLYPAIHVGRSWFDWFMFPVPTYEGMWPQFRSPLMWDVFAVNTYLIVSTTFWYMGLIPDLALMRDRSKTRVRKFLYGLFALGWTGSARQWHNYEKAYLILCGLATLLVFTVSSIVGMDFATAQLAGWHETIFPFYFVAGAVTCGFGMVLVLLIPLRKLCHLEDIITMAHIDKICKMTLMMACVMGYIYIVEFFIAWYSGSPYDAWVFGHRMFGHQYWYGGWIMIGINASLPQLLWIKKVRQNLKLVFVIALLLNIGMWFERFVIIVGSLYQDFLPANWGVYYPTWVDAGVFLGTLGAFFMLYLLFVRFLPMIPVSEVKAVTSQANPHHSSGGVKGAKS